MRRSPTALTPGGRALTRDTGARLALRVLVAAGIPCVALAAVATPAAAQVRAAHAGPVVHVAPDHGLIGGQVVTVTGRGLGKPPANGAPSWFVTQCTAAVRGRMNPSTDTDHCDITHAKALKVSSAGTFTVRFSVVSGIVGDGYCGTAGSATCVIAVATVQGKGTVAPITFETPPSPAQSSPVTPRATTPGG